MLGTSGFCVFTHYNRPGKRDGSRARTQGDSPVAAPWAKSDVYTIALLVWRQTDAGGV